MTVKQISVFVENKAGKLAELTEEKSKLEEQLNGKMERWVYLNDLAEKIQAQNS